MNKITLLMLAFLATLSTYAQFPETFEGPNSLPATWAIFDNGIGTVESWQQSENGFALVLWEAVGAGETAEDWLASPSYTIDATTPVLLFEATPFNAPDYGSTLSVRVQVDGAGSDRVDPSLYTTIETFTETDLLPEATFNTVEVDLSAYAGDDVFIAFVYSNNDGDAWALRNAEFISLATTAPQAVINPDPADQSTVFLSDGGINDEGVQVYQYVFGFELPDSSEPATSYLFELGLDSNVDAFSTTLPSPALTLTGLQFDTTYFWKVTSINSQGSAESPVWSFTTESTLSNNEFVLENDFVHFIGNNKLNIQANTQFNQIQIFDISGKQIINNELNGATEAQIDINTLNTGIYIARINTENGLYSFKFAR
ncbi:T9SS-dependent choice-of-anchor J family protein [Psychroflexus salis]|uniref:Secretion system C-terminal sorting domain-containing protein n=1 Tax=Psychroflexus salis TaxID=1526574 RepID=A0A917A047_9FLAO|nr:choice-of-anchor J domain-containing protein [Psychroflexus salis]GGE20752.1 hypothetical protein GCM10010831_22250 [Psychroflexus salis]